MAASTDDGGRTGAATGVRAAVVGGGLMGRWHARELTRAGGVLVAVADADAAAAGRLAGAHPGARAFGDVAAMLEQAGPQAVHVCTPTASHVAIAALALRAGAHVLVEKPMAPDPEQTGRLIALAQDHGRLVCPVHQYIFQPPFATLEGVLTQIGPLVDVRFTACSAGGLDGTGPQLDAVAADILPHALAVLHRVLPAGIGGLDFTATALGAGELSAASAADGAGVSIRVSMGGRPTRNELRVIGARGTLHLDFFHGFAVVEDGAVSRAHKLARPFRHGGSLVTAAGANLARRTLRGEPAYPGLRTLIQALYAHVRGEGPPPIPHADALAVAQGRERLLQAAGRGG